MVEEKKNGPSVATGVLFFLVMFLAIFCLTLSTRLSEVERGFRLHSATHKIRQYLEGER